MALSTSQSGTHKLSSILNSIYIFSYPNSISKGDPIFIPILAINRSRELWGPDAHEFKCVSFRLKAYIVLRPRPTIGQSGGKTFRKPSRRFQECGATSCPSLVAQEHVSDTGSPLSSESNSPPRCLDLVLISTRTIVHRTQNESAPLHACTRVRIRACCACERDWQKVDYRAAASFAQRSEQQASAPLVAQIVQANLRPQVPDSSVEMDTVCL